MGEVARSNITKVIWKIEGMFVKDVVIKMIL